MSESDIKKIEQTISKIKQERLKILQEIRSIEGIKEILTDDHVLTCQFAQHVCKQENLEEFVILEEERSQKKRFKKEIITKIKKIEKMAPSYFLLNFIQFREDITRLCVLSFRVDGKYYGSSTVEGWNPTTIHNRKNLIECDYDEWQEVAPVITLIKKYAPEYILNLKKKQLCILTDCYNELKRSGKMNLKEIQKICSHCGIENVEKANYCCGCGTPFPN